MRRHRGHWRHGLLVGLAAAAAEGCPTSPEVDCSCGLECPAERLADGNAGISGWAPVDMYFRAALDFGPVAAEVSASIDAELGAIAASLAVARDAPGETLAAAITARVGAALDGGLHVQQASVPCEIETAALVAAAAYCDIRIDPATASAQCQGECKFDAAAATCPPDAVARCIGAAPQCDGPCLGRCELPVASACVGTYRGECSGACSVRDAVGKCVGWCDGACLGACELVGAACAGICTGTCVSIPQDGVCATAELRCQGKAAVACDGTCDGEVSVSTTEPACAAAITGQAAMQARCRPPTMNLSWQWSPALVADPDGQALFRAWLAGHEQHHVALLARLAKGVRVLQAAAELKAARGAVTASIDAEQADFPSLRVLVGLDCARDELVQVAAIVDDETAALQAAVSRGNVVAEALGGGS